MGTARYLLVCEKPIRRRKVEGRFSQAIYPVKVKAKTACRESRLSRAKAAGLNILAVLSLAFAFVLFLRDNHRRHETVEQGILFS